MGAFGLLLGMTVGMGMIIIEWNGYGYQFGIISCTNFWFVLKTLKREKISHEN